MAKRGPTSELNHDNWDDEDSEGEEGAKGEFLQAPVEELQKRVIRVAKRRSVTTSSPANSPFSAFKGFQTSKPASPAPASFSFVLAGTSGVNGHTNPADVKTGSASEAPLPQSESEGAATKSSGSLAKDASSPAGQSECPKPGPSKGSSPDYYSHLKSLNLSMLSWISKHMDDNPYCILTPVFKDYERHLQSINKIKPPPNSEDEASPGTPEAKAKGSDQVKASAVAPAPKPHSKMFPSICKSDSSSDNEEKTTLAKPASLFSKVTSSLSTSSSGSPIMLKMPDTSSSGSAGTVCSTSSDKTSQADTLGVVSPTEVFSTPAEKFPALSASPPAPFQTPALTTPSLFGSLKSGSVFGGTTTTADSKAFNPSSLTFSFGTAPTLSEPPSAFGAKATPAGMFAFSGSGFGSSSTSIFGAPPASTGGFGLGNSGMSFGSLAAKTAQQQSEQAEEENEEPPKVEFNPIKEDGSVYEVTCKVYVRKDGEYKDRGKGQLYIKKVAGGKTQLLARAATSTGQILLNVILNASVPTSKPVSGKNSVLLMCVPTPSDSNPTAVLIRVKTEADADQLLAKLEEHKSSAEQ